MERNDYEHESENIEQIFKYFKSDDYIEWFFRNTSDLITRGCLYDRTYKDLQRTRKLLLKAGQFVKENGLAEKYNEYMNKGDTQ